MSEEVTGGPPRSFYVISGVALVWNLIGVMQYVMRVTMTDAAIAELPADQQAFINEIPMWANAAFAIATNAGALGCLLLLLKKSWAYPLFIISLLGILVQDVHGFALSDGMAVFGSVGVVLAVLVLLVSIFLVWYAKGAKEKGWIS